MVAQVAAPSASTGSSTWLAVAIIVVVVVAIVAFAAERRRSRAPREKRDLTLDIQPLTPGARTRYSEAWRVVQARFVDDPSGAVGDADRLVNDVMRDRGYPVEDTQRRMDDLSAEHSNVLDTYRNATEIAQRSARGAASTEELRQAMVSYRALFAALLEAAPPSSGTVERRNPRRDDGGPTSGSAALSLVLQPAVVDGGTARAGAGSSADTRWGRRPA